MCALLSLSLSLAPAHLDATVAEPEDSALLVRGSTLASGSIGTWVSNGCGKHSLSTPGLTPLGASCYTPASSYATLGWKPSRCPCVRECVCVCVCVCGCVCVWPGAGQNDEEPADPGALTALTPHVRESLRHREQRSKTILCCEMAASPLRLANCDEGHGCCQDGHPTWDEQSLAL